jgi:predicted permease
MSQMGWIARFSLRIRMLLNRKQAGELLRDELHFHLEQQIVENIAAGMNPAEARSAALRAFGNPGLMVEQARATWHWSWLEILAIDLRQSLRSLGRARGFTVVAILVLALGIGANVALFSVVHSVLLQALPFADADRLVRVYEADARGRFQDNIVAGGTFATWKAESKSFTDLAIKRSAGYNLSGTSASAELPEFVSAEIASWNIFPLLGVQPALGRLFTAEDDRPGANGTVVLTWGLWKRRYGGDKSVLGKTISLDARPYTVIGVLPAWFDYPDAKIQLWAPLYHEKSAEMMQMFEAHNFDVVGRLEPGITIEQASAEMNTIQRQIRLQHPDGPIRDAANLRPILDAETYQVKPALYALLAATGCLLLIACLNIANLLIARGATRRRETAIRTALGGSRLRLMRSQILESTVLSAAGGLVGVALAYAGLHWLVSVRGDMPRAQAIHIDGKALLFAFGAVVVSGLLAGLIPALSAADRNILQALQESSRSQTGGAGRVGLRRALLTVEVGLTVILLIGAGLLLKTYQHLRSVNLGCATQNILTMELTLPKGSYNNAIKRVSFAERLTQQVSAIPGVKAVGITTNLPGHGYGDDGIYTIREHPPLPRGQVLASATTFVDPGYFATMQIPLVSGREFLPTERLDQAQSVIVNQALARQEFPGEDPVGKHILSDALRDGKAYEIVGVIGDTRSKLADPARPAIFFPFYLGDTRNLTLTVRTAVDPTALALPIQKAIAGIDRDLPVASVLTMNQVIGQATLEASFDAAMLMAFAVLSLILAAVGLFGVLSFLVSQRTAEIGIRLALGAQRNQVARLMLTDGMKPALLGLLLGLAVSAALSRLIQSMLYGTQPLDPAIFLLVTATLLMVCAAACLLPAWRASRLDPVQALRSE